MFEDEKSYVYKCQDTTVQNSFFSFNIIGVKVDGLRHSESVKGDVGLFKALQVFPPTLHSRYCDDIFISCPINMFQFRFDDARRRNEVNKVPYKATVPSDRKK
jgi:hypothetical protein